MIHESKHTALRRLKIITGQVRGLEKMVQDDKYCIDIINQTEAIREALAGVRNLILKNHLLTHLAHQMKSGQKDQAVKEMMQVYTLVGKK